MHELDRLVEAARRSAAEEERRPGTAAPERHLVIVTCMDARIEPLRLFGLRRGDAHMIRNAGARVTDDTLRSLALSTHILGTREIALIAHTGCGLLGTSNEEVRARIAAGGGDATAIDFLPIDDLDAVVRADAARLRAAPLLPADITVVGFVYDVDTGEVRRVDG